MDVRFVPVETAEDQEALAKLADEIWHEYWPALIGAAQTDYMVEQFQSLEAIKRDMAENAYEYWFVVDEAGKTVGYTGGHEEPETSRYFISKIYLLAEEQVELARANAQCRTALRQEYQQQLAQYRTRIVTSGHSLREKLLIWDRGRDDRLVELCKLFLQTNLPKHRPDFQLEEAYYDWQDDVECLRLFSKEGQAALYPLDPLYQQLSPAFTPHLPPEDPAGFPLVDLAWAARQLESMTENDPR